MIPQLGKTNYSVSAQCPTCQAVTSFDQKGMVHVDGDHKYKGQNYTRVLYVFSQCARCQRGGLAVVPDRGNIQSAALESFFPFSIDAAPLPKTVPTDIQAE